MRTSVNVRAAKIRTSLSLIALLVCLACPTLSGHAQSTVVASLTGPGGVSVVNITSNQSFTLTLTVQTNFLSGGMTYFLASNAAGSGLFRITGINAAGSPYPPPPTICSGAGDPCLLDPVTNVDLGAAAAGTVAPGTYTIATFTFSTLNAPVGQYTISTDRGVMTDRTGGGFADVPFTASATINVVPEPGTVGLGLLGGAMLSVGVWRRRRG